MKSAVRTRRTLITTLIALGFIAAACTSRASAPPTNPGPGATTVESDSVWRVTRLRDVRTGEAFSIDGLRGKLVALEPMAIWCSTCRIQQREVAAALESVASEDVAYIGVDVDPNENVADLAAYATEQGFDWRFIVASRDVARSLAQEFGDQVLSPPSTPLILIGPDGRMIDLHFGIRTADELEALFRQHLP